MKSNDSVKRLALKMACLSKQDQNWLISQLSESQVQRLKSLLQEVQLRGWDRYPELVGSVLNSMQPKKEVSEKPRTMVKLPRYWSLLLASEKNEFAGEVCGGTNRKYAVGVSNYLIKATSAIAHE